jgi:alpha/beta superfamily hydrolase
MKYATGTVLFCLACILSSCLRLDNNLFNNHSITSYQRDAYTGHVDFVLPASYKIEDSMVTLFTLQSNDNGDIATIYAEYIGDIKRIATDTVIMYCHGNRDHMDFYWPRAKLLANTGGRNHYGVLMIDYRGFGLSQGKPTESGMYADVDAALSWLKSHGLTNERLIMYGYSVGSAPAAKLTAEPRSMIPSKLILESPFASAEVMVQDATGLAMPGSYVTNLKINNAEEIKSVQQPFCWIHGIDDDFLNIKTHGEVVYANYHGSYSEAHRVAGANHSTVEPLMGFENYLHTIFDFIRKK